MKVKCYVNKANGRIVLETLDSDIPTSNLIVELERRRPCNKCANYGTHMNDKCVCIWDNPLGYTVDNFKPKEQKQ